MDRTLRCMDCGLRAQLDADDINFGWEQRKVQGMIRKPALVCDQCGTELREWKLAIAVTRWRHEDPPPEWELEYLVPADADVQQEPPADEPYFDIDTDVRPDTDPNIFGGRPVIAQDEWGEYGSFFDKDEDHEVPEPE